MSTSVNYHAFGVCGPQVWSNQNVDLHTEGEVSSVVTVWVSSSKFDYQSLVYAYNEWFDSAPICISEPIRPKSIASSYLADELFNQRRQLFFDSYIDTLYWCCDSYTSSEWRYPPSKYPHRLIRENFAIPLFIKTQTAAQIEPHLFTETKVESYKRDMDWLAENRKNFVGQWIAIKDGVLLASANNAREVYDLAKRQGIKRPFVVFIKSAEELPFGGW